MLRESEVSAGDFAAGNSKSTAQPEPHTLPTSAIPLTAFFDC